MSEKGTVYWLLLVMVFGVGNVKLHDALRGCESVRELYYTLHDPDCSLLTDKERQRLRKSTKDQAEQIIEFCEKSGIGIMTWDDESYPDQLRHIYNPPCVLFYRGDMSLLHEQVILTVVGARHASDYSLKAANFLCSDLARHNVLIASGCALGIDAAAHWAAVNAGKPTIGVLGCSVEYDYPKENRALKERIVQNGLLLSEYFPGTSPLPAHFPARNRILAGIGEAVLVVEAGERSGSLITANLACEQGKQVFCVPPADIFDKRYAGAIGFLRDGAYPAFDMMDILYSLYLKYPYRLALFDEEESSRTQDSLVFRKETPPKQPAKVRTVPVKGRPPVPEEKPYEMPPDATPEQRRILELLRKGGQNVNALCVMLGMEFDTISMLLMEMDLNGWIVNTGRDIYALPEN
ncbi:MAG: DNA-processing protein DprA [Oscillospiraceae bacterium]|nr:DNA-processing protein DprA [Oscillospiraceae bacterium]